jgi:hypothetical protein
VDLIEITPNVGELAIRYINVSGVLKKRHSEQESMWWRADVID